MIRPQLRNWFEWHQTNGGNHCGNIAKGPCLRQQWWQIGKISPWVKCRECQVSCSVLSAIDAVISGRAIDGIRRENCIVKRLHYLDAVQVNVWPKVQQADVPAGRLVLGLSARRAALLGLDAPTKVTPTNLDGTRPYRHETDEALDARIRELAKEAGFEIVGGEVVDQNDKEKA